MLGPKIGAPAALATVNAASNNIPTAFADSAGSLIAVGKLGYSHLIVYNTTVTDIIISVSAGNGTHTAAIDQLVCPGASNGGVLALDDVDISTNIYIRSTSGSAITSGKVYIALY